MSEPESLVLQLLREMRADMASKGDLAELRSDVVDLRSEVHSLRADTAADFVTVRAEAASVEKRLSEQIVGLRRAVMEYHSSAIGHGLLISEFEERLRRVEQHLNLPPQSGH